MTLRIGVLLVDTVQLLDLAAIDLLYMTTPEYLQECSLPQPLVDMGRPCSIHYIANTVKGENTVNTTSQMTIQSTNSLTDSAISPGKLDIVVIPGPPPKAMPPAEEYLDFVRGHFAAGTPILSICTGAFVIGYAGITRGREVTAPRLLIPEMKRRFPEAKVWDDSVRVARDGNLWTSGMFFSSSLKKDYYFFWFDVNAGAGGITNGHDLVIAYLREHYPAALVNTILVAADIPVRPAKYASSATSDTAYVLWQVIRAIPNALGRLFGGK
jgi:putative intracellular protease/amidase